MTCVKLVKTETSYFNSALNDLKRIERPVRVDLEVMVKKLYSTLTKAPQLIQFNIASKTLVGREVLLFSRCWGGIIVFYSPQQGQIFMYLDL